MLTEQICLAWLKAHAEALLGPNDEATHHNPEETVKRMVVWQYRLEYVRKHGPTRVQYINSAHKKELHENLIAGNVPECSLGHDFWLLNPIERADE